MNENLLSLVQQWITPDFIHGVSHVLGENPEKVQAGFKSVIPTFLAGLFHKGSTLEGARSIINSAKGEDSAFSNPAQLMDYIKCEDASMDWPKPQG